MLVLSRKPGETIVTSNGITVTVAEIKGNRVRLAFDAPDDVRILRAELAPIERLEMGNRRQLIDPDLPTYHSEWGQVDDDPAAEWESRLDSATCFLPKTEQTGTVKIITFTSGQVRTENVLASELEGLTDELGECHLLLDFANVEYVTSVELGTLVNLHKKMKASGGRLTLFNLNLHVFEVFLATHLDALIGICR
jgi:carbon storage regulator CsrA